MAQYIAERKKKETIKLKNDEEDYGLCNCMISLSEKEQARDLEKYRRKKKELNERIKEKNILEESINADKKLLENYSNIANKEYHAYMERVKAQYCKKGTSGSDKVNLLIYMALLEKDYQSIMGEL